MDSEEEKILMTTTRPAVGHTILKMERLTATQLDENGAMHVGGGDNKGIIINRPGVTVKSDLDGKAAHLNLSFKVFLVNLTTTKAHVEEHRSLKFWFKEGITESDQLMTAQEFFRDLVNPSDFPRDYVGFIMKVIKLLQRKFLTIRQIQLDMKQSEEKSELPSRPGKRLKKSSSPSTTKTTTSNQKNPSRLIRRRKNLMIRPRRLFQQSPNDPCYQETI